MQDIPTQKENRYVYVFPGLGLGVTIARSRLVTDRMFLVAAKRLAKEVTEADLEQGRIYPPLTRIREVSAAIAESVAEVAYESDLATEPRPEDLFTHIKAYMYKPSYENYVGP